MVREQMPAPNHGPNRRLKDPARLMLGTLWYGAITEKRLGAGFFAARGRGGIKRGEKAVILYLGQ